MRTTGLGGAFPDLYAIFRGGAFEYFPAHTKTTLLLSTIGPGLAPFEVRTASIGNDLKDYLAIGFDNPRDELGALPSLLASRAIAAAAVPATGSVIRNLAPP